MSEKTTTVPAALESSDASVEAKEVKKKPRRRESDRIEYNRYRKDALEFAYRFGGGVPRQLAEWLLLKHPNDKELRKQGKAKVSPSLRAAYRTIESMKRSRLVKKVAVVREHLDGFEGRVAREDFFYLSPANSAHAVVWAGSICGVTKASKARVDYQRHQLPSRPEHAAWRTDLILLQLRAALDAGVEAPIEDAFGESDPGYPYWIAKPGLDKAGEPLPERKNGRAYYDPVIPDGCLSLYGVRVDVEVERWTRTGAVGESKGVVPKVERHASHWLRLIERRENAWVREWRANYRREKKGGEPPSPIQEAAYRASLGRAWFGMPDGVAPLVIVMRDHESAVRMRDRVVKAISSGGLPRYVELAGRMGDHRLRLGRLVLFVGWDRLIEDGPLEAGHSALSTYGEGGGGWDGVSLAVLTTYAEECRKPREA